MGQTFSGRLGHCVTAHGICLPVTYLSGVQAAILADVLIVLARAVRVGIGNRK